jgi:hypothetical protein
MKFDNRPTIPVLRKPVRLPPISVGRHVFVNGAPNPTERLDPVPLTDDADMRTLRTLTDGEEVEVLAWRQRQPVRYHVRCIADGAEGWVAAESLRASRTPVPEVTPENRASEPAAPAVPDTRAAPSRRKQRGGAATVAKISPPPVGTPQVDTPVACPVCGEEVHPYNLSRSTKGAVVGCFVCRGRKR